jgi:hypothetical protein
MEVFLLGGSNSVLKGGLNSGWLSSFHLKNMAIGASSSLQNLHSLLRIKSEIQAGDLVVTESNVNDSFSISVHGSIYIDDIFKNIDSFYFELDKINCNKLVILMPFRNYLGKQESQEIVDLVNQRHLNNANKYGFYLINLVNVFSSFQLDDLKYLMPDGRHTLQVLMHHLAKNISDFFVNQHTHVENHSVNHSDRSHTFFDLSELNIAGTKKKSNSIFEEEFLELNESFRINKSFIGYRIVGLGTWSDGQSTIRIQNKKVDILKSFNALNAFNELLTNTIVDEDTVMSSYFGDRKVTERSINCSNSKSTHNVNLTSILFRKPDFNVDLTVDCNSSIDLNFLVPDLNPYISTLKFYLTKNEEYYIDLGLNVEKLLSISEEIKGFNISSARYLLEIAYKIRPSVNIKRKLDSLI